MRRAGAPRVRGDEARFDRDRASDQRRWQPQRIRGGSARGVRRIVYSSSIAAYGVVHGHPNPIVESTLRQRQPGFTYAMTKFDVEEGLDAFERAHPEVSVARLRPSILVGTIMDHPPGAAMRRRVMPDTTDAPLPIVWDEDVADAVVLALAAAAHGAFNLSSDGAMTGKQLAGATEHEALSRPARLGADRGPTRSPEADLWDPVTDRSTARLCGQKSSIFAVLSVRHG